MRNWAILLTIFLTGCKGVDSFTDATDPTERGLSFVAAAIVTSAVIRAFFNK
jgi:hypothetical protein